MIDGVAGRPFSAETLVPFSGPEASNKEKIINVSRERYGTPRKEVEEKIVKWLGLSDAPNISIKTSEAPVLYDAVCSMCNKPTKVVFSPDGKRPVYCKTCLKKIRSGEEKTNKQESILIPFSRKRKRKEVNLSELRKTLSETLEKKDDENENS